MGEIYNTALRYTADGSLSVIPIRMDGSKAPAVKSWRPYQKAIATAEELKLLFPENVGVAIACGFVSGNLEDIDFDDMTAYKKWYALVEQQAGRELLDRLVKIQTPRPGVAVLYRCPDGIQSNQKLAQRLQEGKSVSMIETRGEGGYFLAPGCPPQCHPTGRLYEVKHGDILNIQTITGDNRTVLLDLARSLNECAEPDKILARATPEYTSKPGQVYSDNTQWKDILCRHGWVHVFSDDGCEYWRRPGKNVGISATVNYKGSNLLYVFSSNAQGFQQERTYTKFGAYAALNHRGDYNLAAKTLAKEGFGIELESQQMEDIHPYIELAPAFLATTDPPVTYLINELIPESILALIHGQPRTRKSWIALELAISLATGTCAFGLSRFGAVTPSPVLYLSQEDPARDVRRRAKAILKGKQIDEYPETLAFSIHKGINLESYEWQEALLKDIPKYGFRLVIFDPVRRFSPNVDKGPAEVRAITGCLRRLVIETGACFINMHHDVKPLRTEERTDTRRGHRASGGDWFAASDCPISVDEAGPDSSLVIPEDYKFSVDPQAFSFKLETDDPVNPTSARLVGLTTEVKEAETFRDEEKILNAISEHPSGMSGNAISKTCHIRRENVMYLLENLSNAGKIDSYGSGKKGGKHLWILHQKTERETL